MRPAKYRKPDQRRRQERRGPGQRQVSASNPPPPGHMCRLAGKPLLSSTGLRAPGERGSALAEARHCWGLLLLGPGMAFACVSFSPSCQ